MEGLRVPLSNWSYDVKAPDSQDIPMIRHTLEEDNTLPDRCELSVDQVITLPEICLDTTYFLYGEGVGGKSVPTAAMGSSESPLVANL